MTPEIASALCGYFETLYDLNKNLITLCGIEVIDNYGQYEKLGADIIQAIPRLVPYFKENGRCKLDVKDGLLEFATEIPFLKDDYESIFTQNYDFLSKVKEIRNKFEHKMHGAELISIGRGNMIIFNLSYKIKTKDQWINLYAGEFLKFTKQINELFSKLQNQVASFPHQQDQTMDPYYRRLIRYDFCDFNQIYDSPLLKIVGKTLVPF